MNDIALWNVSPSPGAPPITLNGTVEQVYAKLLEINPNYDKDWGNANDEGKIEGVIHSNFDLDVDVDTAVGSETDIHAGLESRDDLEPLHPREGLTCEADRNADMWHIHDGIRYLRKVKGQPVNDPGQCGRVSCSGNSAIWWCNLDPDHRKVLPSFNNIADGAQVIADNCRRGPNRVRGKLGHRDRWQVIVQHAKC
ncbi:hypothetical protein BJX63DRAFT_146361 [Aspergillus granulosus]|uniref:Uncharacterized protein n=1 Tax=Aspergillus granulosus TaxID=176169 RepID=A0ABR4GS10_9EURO